MYQEALRRDRVESFLEVLRSPVSSANNVDAPHILPGCGLSFIAQQIKDHFDDSKHRSNNLTARLIGRQAIALARYGYRLIGILKIVNESPAEKLNRQAVGKAM